MADPLKFSLLQGYVRRANTEQCPTMREVYRQLAIDKASEINVTLTPDDFPAFPGKTLSVPEENAVVNVENNKIEVPNALPEYPGVCPVCNLAIKNQMSWIGHKKVHSR